MNKYLVFLFAAVLISCGHANYGVNKSLDVASERNRVFLQLIIKTDKLAPGANFENRDSLLFRQHYINRMRIHDFAGYFLTDTVRYFMLYRVAPSLFKEKFAIGGRYTTGKDGQIIGFEELFITPKMKESELDQKAGELFAQLVTTGNIDEYVKNRKYVDFPDELNTYNKKLQRWEFTLPKH